MVENDKVPFKNPEGYADPTPFKALNRNAQERDEADQRHYRLIKTLMNAIDLMGYDILCRIEVRDRVSGRIYR